MWKGSQLFLMTRLFICIGAVGFTLFAYIEKQNELTELRLAIPVVKKELTALVEENIALKYEIESFENPVHLMELMRNPEYSHLKYPYLSDEIFLPKAAPLKEHHD